MSTAELSPPAQPLRCTPEDYLRLERAAENKNEYFEGEMWPMVGASLNHIRICMNLYRILGTMCRDSALEVLGESMRVRTGQNYFYPDVLLVRGTPEVEDAHNDTLRNPVAIFEVLSPSTEAFDRGKKFAAYTELPTLREYLLVSQNAPRIELWKRQDHVKGEWDLSVIQGLDATLPLLSGTPEVQSLLVPLSEVYDRVTF